MSSDAAIIVLIVLMLVGFALYTFDPFLGYLAWVATVVLALGLLFVSRRR